MTLSDRDILARLADGDLAIDPLDDPELQVQPASVDLRLGREFLEFERTNIPCIHPNSEQEVDEYVSQTVIESDGEFILHPGDFVLGTTHERVRIPDDLIAHVEGRSSLGRLAIVVHASLPADEELFLWTPEDGLGFYPIGEIVEQERPARAVAFDPTTLSISTHRVTGYIENPTKRLYRITLNSGRQVHVTRDHNLFTLNDHGQVRRIPSETAEGTRVMVPRRLPPSPSERSAIDLIDYLDPAETTLYATDGLGGVDWDCVPPGSRRYYQDTKSAPLVAVSRRSLPADVTVAFKQSDLKLPRDLPLTSEFGWVLGFYIAEGSARRKQIQVSNTDRDLLNRFAAYFEDTGTSLSWYETSNVTRLTVCSALWSKLFRELVGSGRAKLIPDQAWDWPTPVLESLLEGLIDGDGCRRDTRDTIYTGNATLANRIMYLAARLGRRSSMYVREREIHIEPSDVDWSGEMWSVDVDNGHERHKKGQYVPVPSALLSELRTEAGLDLRAAATNLDYNSESSITNVEQHHYDGIKRSTLRRFRDAYRREGADTSRVDRILEGHVDFEKVVSVEETARTEPTYDLEVQPNGDAIENFLGGRGGIFLSNTAGLCDPGYRGQITLELSNLGTAPVALTPGMRISQLTFTELSSPAERPYGSERGSKYQDQSGPQASKIQGDREFGGDQ